MGRVFTFLCIFVYCCYHNSISALVPTFKVIQKAHARQDFIQVSSGVERFHLSLASSIECWQPSPALH